MIGKNRSVGRDVDLRVSGEMHKPRKDRHQRRHFSMMLSLIKDVGLGIKKH